MHIDAPAPHASARATFGAPDAATRHAFARSLVEEIDGRVDDPESPEVGQRRLAGPAYTDFVQESIYLACVERIKQEVEFLSASDDIDESRLVEAFQANFTRTRPHLANVPDEAFVDEFARIVDDAVGEAASASRHEPLTEDLLASRMAHGLHRQIQETLDSTEPAMRTAATLELRRLQGIGPLTHARTLDHAAEARSLGGALAAAYDECRNDLSQLPPFLENSIRVATRSAMLARKPTIFLHAPKDDDTEGKPESGYHIERSPHVTKHIAEKSREYEFSCVVQDLKPLVVPEIVMLAATLTRTIKHEDKLETGLLGAAAIIGTPVWAGMIAKAKAAELFRRAMDDVELHPELYDGTHSVGIARETLQEQYGKGWVSTIEKWASHPDALNLEHAFEIAHAVRTRLNYASNGIVREATVPKPIKESATANHRHRAASEEAALLSLRCNNEWDRERAAAMLPIREFVDAERDIAGIDALTAVRSAKPDPHISRLVTYLQNNPRAVSTGDVDRRAKALAGASLTPRTMRNLLTTRLRAFASGVYRVATLPTLPTRARPELVESPDRQDDRILRMLGVRRSQVSQASEENVGAV